MMNFWLGNLAVVSPRRGVCSIAVEDEVAIVEGRVTMRG